MLHLVWLKRDLRLRQFMHESLLNRRQLSLF